MSLNDALAAWAKSPAGKQKIKAAQIDALKNKQHFGTHSNGKPGGDASYEASHYANVAKQIIQDEIDAVSADYKFADYLLIGEPFWDEAKEKWVIEMTFDPDKTNRDSLYPSKYPENSEKYIKDIVALLNHGYDANGQVYGYWPTAGKRVASVDSRSGLYFIQKAAQYFNSKFYGEAELKWHPKYDGGPLDQVWEE